MGGGAVKAIASVASVIPGPWQAPALVFTAVSNAAEGNLVGAGLAGFGAYNIGLGGATDSFTGVDDWTNNTTGGSNYWDQPGPTESYFDAPLNTDQALNDFGYNNLNEYSTAMKDGGEMVASKTLQDIGNSGWTQEAGKALEGVKDLGTNNLGSTDQNILSGSQSNNPFNNQSGGSNSLDLTGSNSYNPDPNAFKLADADNVNSEVGDLTTSTPTKLEGNIDLNVQDSNGEYINNVHDDWGGGTNSTGDFTNGAGNTSWQNKMSTGLRDIGVSRDTAGSMTQGSSNMWDYLNEPAFAGKNAPSRLVMGGKIAGGLANMYANNQAMNYMKGQLAQANSWEDPNRARGDFANQAWQNNMSDSMYGYNDFMKGAGQEFTNNARAAAAKSGNRGGYLNSGRMQSDLASLYAKNQMQRSQALAGGFANASNPSASLAPMTTAYANMQRNQFSSLGDLFGQWQGYNKKPEENA